MVGGQGSSGGLWHKAVVQPYKLLLAVSWNDTPEEEGALTDAVYHVFEKYGGNSHRENNGIRRYC